MNENESWLAPVPKRNLSRMVTDKITEALANGQLKPGDYLPSENQLAERLNVGKSSVREATKMLEAVGVIEIIKGHGCRVRTDIDADALNPLAYQLILQSNTNHGKLLEFRQTIECLVSCMAVKTITDEELSELKSIHAKMLRNRTQGKETLDLDILFHKRIYASTQNPFFACLGTAIMTLFEPSIAVSNTDHPEIVLENHARIIAAFESRDEGAMSEAIQESIKSWEALSLNKPSGRRIL